MVTFPEVPLGIFLFCMCVIAIGVVQVGRRALLCLGAQLPHVLGPPLRGHADCVLGSPAEGPWRPWAGTPAEGPCRPCQPGHICPGHPLRARAPFLLWMENEMGPGALRLG